MTRILITGIAGFVGSYMAELLLQDPAVQITGVVHPTHEMQHLNEHPRISIYRQDILKATPLKRLLKSIQPEVIYHLAGLAHVHESWKNKKETINTNFWGSFHLLEACGSLSAYPKVLLIGSADCYGLVPEAEQPIPESRPLFPSSPYAVSKIAQEMLGLEYAYAEKRPVFLSRSFNHTGPRQKETFVCSAFAKQIVSAELGLIPAEIRVGNLIAKRDFSDVRDVVTAYQAIVEKGNPGEPYNVCSGSAISIEQILQILLSLSGTKLSVIPDPDKFRPVDMPLLLGSPAKLQKQTGWKPRYDIRITLQDLLEYWRMKLRTSAATL